MDKITLPLGMFLEVLLEEEPLTLPTRPVSIKPGVPDGPVRICRLELGALLKEIDREEKYVKVFLFPATHHAEVWSIKVWRESATKYFRDREEQKEHNEESFALLEKEKKIQEVAERLSDYMKKSQALVYARMIVEKGKVEELEKLLLSNES